VLPTPAGSGDTIRGGGDAGCNGSDAGRIGGNAGPSGGDAGHLGDKAEVGVAGVTGVDSLGGGNIGVDSRGR
jgi:hypothetical protein